MCIEQLIEILKSLLTPIIAFTALYIAWQQWKTNEQKLKLEMYDRKFHVYDETKNILFKVIQDLNPTIDDIQKFQRNVSEADFLFKSEIPQYIDEICKHCLNLWKWKLQYKDYTQKKPKEYDHEKVCKEIKKEEDWFVKQIESNLFRKKFHKYLDISK